MSGHSKWATIRRKKAVTDAKRGKMFTQIIKEITIAARLGGGDPSGNPRLRLAIDKAKSGNMPADNIKRAIQKGTGELPGMAYEDATYEAYGPAGVALLIEAVTDNKTRTVNEIRHVLDRNHGKLAASGSVAYQFHRKGQITVLRNKIGEDELMGIILDAGADDMASDEEHFFITSIPDVLEKVKKAIEDRKIPIEHSEIQMVPENTVKVEGKDAETLIKLIEGLEDHDDIQHVYGNFDIDESVLASLNAG
ncbi:MAG: YebC/PmpR family DNA-binding transcriptional regulator [Ignavibacteriales bacterium]|nr:YebC/PmpR family DNA-binding transcriptional regulator [Ignavibacteriales bacterium]